MPNDAPSSMPSVPVAKLMTLQKYVLSHLTPYSLSKLRYPDYATRASPRNRGAFKVD